jgi:multidrug transporter EmrE-like cation transporter
MISAARAKLNWSCMYIVLLIAASLLFATGGIFMKYSAGLTNLRASAGVFACFCLGAACQSIAMRRAEMSVVYVFVLGLEAVAAFVLSVWVLDERVTSAKVLALVLIVAGIVLLERA